MTEIRNTEEIAHSSKDEERAAKRVKRDCDFEWTIPGFASITEEKLTCKELLKATYDNASWALSLFPNGAKEENKGWLELSLNLQQGSIENLKAHIFFKLRIINHLFFERTLTKQFDYVYDTTGENKDGCGFHKVIERSEVLKESNGFLLNGNLTITWQLQMFKDCCQKDESTNDDFDFKWVIPHFSAIKNRKVFSQDFFRRARETPESWSLSLHPNLYDEGNLVLFLTLKYCKKSKIYATYELRIINHLFPHKTWIKRCDSIFEKADDNNCVGIRALKRSEMLDGFSGFLVHGNLTVTCKLKVMDDLRRKEELLANQEKLLGQCQFTDCVLVCEESEIPACKFLLASQSAIFHFMFSGDTAEAKSGRVVIDDCSRRAIVELCRFTSCGRVENLDEIVDELLPAADKYGVENLKTMCAARMCESLSKLNAAHRLFLADRHSIFALKEAAIEFIALNDIELFELANFNFTDCVLVCKDGDVPACKYILARKSSVFRSMFSGNTIEAKTGRILVDKDCSNAAAMRELFRYTCCNEVEDLDDLIEVLLPAADKYAIENLKTMCADYMQMSLTKENALRRLIIADRCNVVSVAEAAKIFIADSDIELVELHGLNDCVLVCKDGEVPAFKDFLVRKSPVFRSMFANDSTKAQDVRIAIDDCSAAAIKELCWYTLCGKMKKLNELADELLPVLVKFDFDELKCKCVDEMCNSLRMENVVHRMVLADRHDLVNLKEAAVIFNGDNDLDLFVSAQLADCLLVCKDGEVPAIKFLLERSSAVLHAIFSVNELESKNGRISIYDHSANTMKELFRFTCCSRVHKLDEIAEDLLLAAVEYDIKKLKTLCLDHMCSSLSTANVVRRALIADSHNLFALKEAAIRFIVRVARATGEFSSMDNYNELFENENLVQLTCGWAMNDSTFPNTS